MNSGMCRAELLYGMKKNIKKIIRNIYKYV